LATQSPPEAFPDADINEPSAGLTPTMRREIASASAPVVSRHPDAGATLESILCTDELHRRPSRAPDYEAENRALVALAGALSDSPQTVLQTLADTILEMFQCGSAGMSLLMEDGSRFYWPAIAGVWKAHVGGGTPREFGPCGDTLDRNIPLLFTHFERRYPYLRVVTPTVEECLLVPFYVAGKAVGTIWAMAHDHSRKFDAEDRRQLVSLARFASVAYQASSVLTSDTADMVERMHSKRVMLRKNETFLAGQRDAFELAMSGAPILAVLDRIAQVARELFDADGGARAAIFTVDPDGKRLRFAVAAGMAEAYTRAVDGMVISLHNPSCGSVAYTGETVIVSDVATDPRWAPYLHLANANDIQACWSFPISAIGGKVLGTLAVYHRAPREPEPRHLETIGLLAQTAGAILERHKVLEHLRDSEERYRTLFDSMDEGFCIVEMIYDERGCPIDYVCLEANPSFVKQTGIEGLVGRRISDISPNIDPEVLKIYGEVIRTGEPVRFVNESKALDRWFDINAFQVGGRDSLRVAVVFNNVSERVRAAEALRQSEARFRALFNEVPVGIYSCDRDGMIDEANPLAIQLWGRAPTRGDPKDRFCASHMAYLPDGTYMSHEQTPMVAVLNGNLPAVRDAEVVLERPDGSRVTIIANIVPLKNDSGEITGVMNCFYDVTERKRAGNALRESEERYRNLFDSIDEGFCVIEMIFDEADRPVDYRFLEVNPAFEVQSGLQDATGKRIRELVPDIEAQWFEIYGNVVRTGKPVRLTNEVKSMNRWLDVYGCRVGGPDSRKVAVVFNDVTERKQAEKKYRGLLESAPDAMVITDDGGSR
jgi:PAS domain S-box-containing protein